VEALARKVAAFRIGDSGIEGAPREVADELNGVRSLLRVVATRLRFKSRVLALA
jgi:hypothetical protein